MIVDFFFFWGRIDGTASSVVGTEGARVDMKAKRVYRQLLAVQFDEDVSLFLSMLRYILGSKHW